MTEPAEVGDPDLRRRLFDVFRDADRHWRCPMVVASRPIWTEELREMGFRVATVEPFGEHEVRLFVDHWVAALHDAGRLSQPGETGGLGIAGESHRRELLQAPDARPRVRRLAGWPPTQ